MPLAFSFGEEKIKGVTFQEALHQNPPIIEKEMSPNPKEKDTLIDPDKDNNTPLVYSSDDDEIQYINHPSN